MAEDVRIRISVSAKDGIKGLRDFGIEVDKTTNKVKIDLDKMGDSFKKVGRRLSLFVTAPLTALGGVAIKTAGEFEKQRIAFETMLGSGEKASKLLKDIIEYSAKTPFQLKGLEDSAAKLMSFGISADEVVDKMRMLGDVAMGDQEKLSRLVYAFGKLRSRGVATMEELNMFIDAGVPILEKLANRFGVAQDQLFKMITQGKVTFKDVNAALEEMTSKGGMFYRMTERQATSLLGLFSTLKDNVMLLMQSFGDMLLPVLKKITDRLIVIVQKFRELDDSTKKVIMVIAGLSAVLPPLIMGLGGLMKAVGTVKTALSGLKVGFMLLKSPIGVIITAIGFLITAGLLMYKHWDKIKVYMINIWNVIKNAALTVFNAIKRIVLTPIVKVLEGIKKLASVFGLSGAKIQEAIDKLNAKIVESGVKVDDYKNKLTGSVKALMGNKKAADELKNKMNELQATTEGANQKLQETVNKMNNLNTSVNNANQSVNGLKNSVNNTVPQITSYFSNINRASEYTKQLTADTDNLKDMYIQLSEVVNTTFKNSFADAWESIWTTTGDTSKKVKEAMKDLFVSLLKAIGRQYAIMSAAALVAFQFGRAAKYAALSAAAYLGAQFVSRLQQGGVVYAQGGANYGGGDTIPAMLEPGEMVIRKEVVREHYSELQAINSGENAPLRLTIYLGSNLIFDEISKATRDGRIVVDKRAVR